MGLDVLVIGGGPAGLAAAIAACQRGFKVALADSARPPIDKPCGEGIMPDGVAALSQLGVAPGTQQSFPFTGIRFVNGGLRAQAFFPGRCGLGIRRSVLHQLLLDRAAETGVTMLWATPVTLEGEAVRIGRETVNCRWILVADGQHSRIRHSLGMKLAWKSKRRVGLRHHFAMRPWTDMVEVYWQSGLQAYVTPVASKEICVAIIGAPGARMSNLGERFPELAQRLDGARASSAIRGAISMSSGLRRVVGGQGRAALVGDASGSIDAIAGEGLSLAFRQALALADALAQNNLELYQRAHRNIGRMSHLMARLMLVMSEHAWLRRRVLAALAHEPQMFTRLLGVHSGTLAPVGIGLTGVARLGLRFLNPFDLARP